MLACFGLRAHYAQLHQFYYQYYSAVFLILRVSVVYLQGG